VTSGQETVGDSMVNTTMPRAKSFRDLQVWQRAIEMTVARDFPREEIFGITSQLKRSAASVPSNIAEGQGRLNTREFRQFLGIARGSNCELHTQLEICRALNLGDPILLDHAESLSHEIGKNDLRNVRKAEDMNSRSVHCSLSTVHHFWS